MAPARLTSDRVMLAWELGAGLSPSARANALLATLDCDAAVEAPTIGARDLLLFRVREEAFGPTMAIRADCPGCGRTVDAGVGVGDILAPGAATDAPGATRRLDGDGWGMTYRLPTIHDMDAAAATRDVAAARAVLIDACVIEASADGRCCAAAALPPAAIDALAAAIEEWDPLVETAMAIDCPACGHAWHAVLEIGGYLHAEIGDAAMRIARDVDELARRYGWPERDILAMSAARRAIYLDQRAQAA